MDTLCLLWVYVAPRRRSRAGNVASIRLRPFVFLITFVLARRLTSTFKYNIEMVRSEWNATHDNFLRVFLSLQEEHYACLITPNQLLNRQALFDNTYMYIHVVSNQPGNWYCTFFRVPRPNSSSQRAAKSLISTSTAGLYTLTDSRALTAHPRCVPIPIE